MAYVVPTIANLKARFREFSIVDDAFVQLILDEAIAAVGASWHEDDRAKAQLYLTAHLLSMEGEPDRTAKGSSAGAQDGAVKSYKVGDVSTEYIERAAAMTGARPGSAITAEYARTRYGSMYVELMRLNHYGPMVV